MQCTLQVDQQSNSSESSTSQVAAGQEITGQSVSSLHRLKDINNEGEYTRTTGYSRVMADHLRNLRWRLLRVRRHLNPRARKAQAQLQSVRAQKVSKTRQLFGAVADSKQGHRGGCLPQIHHVRALQRGSGKAVAGPR
jgi:hypothetical protein